MRLWCRSVIRRRLICLCILLLAVALVALVLSDLAFWDKSPRKASSPPRRPLHIFRPPDLEVIVDSRDPVAGLGVGLSPLASFQEDELLFVAETQGSRNPAALPRRKEYKVLLPGINRATGVSTSVTHRKMAKYLGLLGLQSDTELPTVQTYGFNEALSEEIPLRRMMPETRHPACLGEQYSESLPSASVIICFHDEAWSTLLRTVHSVLDTVPKQFLHEVLLVDDLSQLESVSVRVCVCAGQSEDFDVTERLRLKTALGCRNIQWFLSTVYPELYIPQDRPGLSGELYNVGTGYCADYPRGQGLHSGDMNIAPCSGTGSQYCELNSRGEVHWGLARGVCFDGKVNKVVLSPCPNRQPTHSNFQWNYIKLSGQLVHLRSQLCLEAVKKGGFPLSAWAQGREANDRSIERRLRLRPCMHHPRQQWHFEQLVDPKHG